MWHLPRRISMFFLLVALVGVLTACGTRMATAQTQTLQHSSSATVQNPDEYVGNDTCATCHQDTSDSMVNNPHSKQALLHGGTGVVCEGCHGPGKAHVDGGGDV